MDAQKEISIKLTGPSQQNQTNLLEYLDLLCIKLYY